MDDDDDDDDDDDATLDNVQQMMFIALCFGCRANLPEWRWEEHEKDADDTLSAFKDDDDTIVSALVMLLFASLSISRVSMQCRDGCKEENLS